MRSHRTTWTPTRVSIAAIALLAAVPAAADDDRKPTSYGPVVITESFETIMARMQEAKPEVIRRHRELLERRYRLVDCPSKRVSMSRGKPVQTQVRVRLEPGVTWERLAGMTPLAIREAGLFPEGFLPLPHPNHPEAGMVFPAPVRTGRCR